MLNVLSLRPDSCVMGGIFWMYYLLLPLLPCYCKMPVKISQIRRNITGGSQAILESFNATWWNNSCLHWLKSSYIRSAVPYLNRKAVNHPVQPQQHNDFLPSEDDQWWSSTDCKLFRAAFSSKETEQLFLELWSLCLVASQPLHAGDFCSFFPCIINFSEQGVEDWDPLSLALFKHSFSIT